MQNQKFQQNISTGATSDDIKTYCWCYQIFDIQLLLIYVEPKFDIYA